MPINAKFSADFTSFYDAVQKADAQLKDFQSGAGQVEKSVNRLADSFSGRKIIQEATLSAKALEDVGGVSTLTAKELQSMGAKAAEAIEKMQKTGITEIPKHLQDIADAAKAAQQPTEGLGVSFQKLVGSYVTGQAIIGVTKEAFGALTGFVEDSIKAAGEAEKAHTQLVAALRSQGTAIPSVIDAFSGYATQLQRTTIYQDDAIESAEALLVQIGNVMPQDMQRALQATTDLASGLGIDLDSAVRLVAKSAEGNVSALKRVGVVVDETKVKQEGFGAVLDAITAKFGGQAAALAGTYEGRLAQLGNTWNNLEESVGRAITTNGTVIELFTLVNGAIDKNTGELRDNKTVTDAISGSVILAGQSVGFFARTLDTIQTVAAGFVIGLLDIDIALGKVALGAARASAAIALGQGDLNGYRLATASAQALQASLASEQKTIEGITSRSVSFGNALQSISAQAGQLTAKLEATRGEVVTLQDRTDGATNAWDRHTQAVVDTGAAEKKAAEDAKRLTDEHGKLTAKLFEVEHGFDVTGLSAAKLGDIGEHVAIKLHTLNEEIEALQRGGQFGGAALLKLGGQIAGGGGSIADVQLAGIGTLPDVPSGALHQLEAVDKDTKDWHQALNDTSQALAQLAQVSGGTFGGIVQELSQVVSATNAISTGFAGAKNAGGGFTGFLSKLTGSLSIVTGAVSLVGGVVKALNIGGPSKAELQSRKDRDKAFAPLGGTNDTGIQTAEDALTRFGATAEDAQRIVGKALDAGSPKAFAAAMAPVNAALAKAAALDKQVSNVTGMVSAYENAGHVIPQSMLQTIQALQKLPGLTDAEKASLQGLVDSAKPNFDALESVAEKYGTTLQSLGPKLSQGQLDSQAQSLYQDFEDLTNAGGEAGNVIGAMQGKLGDLVKAAEDSGSALPSFLKDILGNFGDTIKDSNGDLLDLTKITFDDTPTADGLQGMQDDLTTLQVQLSTDVPAALNALLGQIPSNPFAGWQVPSVPAASSASHAATGGIVTPSGGGKVLPFPGGPSGTDTVPAWLTPKEAVLTESQQRAIRQQLASPTILAPDQQRALTSNGSADRVTTVIVELDGREIANQTTKHQTRDLHVRTRVRAA